MVGLAAGDVTLAQRMVSIQFASLAVLFALRGATLRALLEWLAVSIPAWAQLPLAPALLTPFMIAPLFMAILGARRIRDAALLAGLAGAGQILGSAAWIFHYFDRPAFPALATGLIAAVLWAFAGGATRSLAQRGAALGAAPVLWAFIDWVRGGWMDPPLPGLFLAHATAESGLLPLAALFDGAGGEWLQGLAVATIGLVTALLLRHAAGWGLVRSLAGVFALGMVLAWFAPRAAGVRPGADASARAPGEVRVCAVSDPFRVEQGSAAFDGGGHVAVSALLQRAEHGLDCEIVVLPEYSVKLGPRELDSAPPFRPGSMSVVAGAFALVRERVWVREMRNVACRLSVDAGRRLTCADPVDKLVFAPLGESALFQDQAGLAGLGHWISERVMGRSYTQLVAERTQGTISLDAGRRAGSALCWEILVPGIFQRRGISRGDADLLVVPSDLDGFGASTVAIEQFRRAAILHATRLRMPLLFAGTHGAFLVDRDGQTVAPVHEESFFTVWETSLD